MLYVSYLECKENMKISQRLILTTLSMENNGMVYTGRP